MNKVKTAAPPPKGKAGSSAAPPPKRESVAGESGAAGGAAAQAAAGGPAPSPTSSDKKKKPAKVESDDDDDTTEKAPEKEDPAGVAEANQLKAEIDPILRAGGFVKALTNIVESKGKSKELQKMQETLALTAMENIKGDDISKIVDGAADDVLDTLMRITYAGMATGKNCPALLIWHAKITDKAGIGAIMRAMCARNGF